MDKKGWKKGGAKQRQEKEAIETRETAGGGLDNIGGKKIDNRRGENA
jgi:hypothetical protein